MVRDYLFLENTVFFILQLRFVTFYLVPCTDLANSTIVVPPRLSRLFRVDVVESSALNPPKALM